MCVPTIICLKEEFMNLTTSYLGLQLSNPIIASASPLSRSLDSIRRLEECGVSAIVMYSLFEEQIIHEQEELEHYKHYGAESFAEALSYFPDTGDYNLGPDQYVELIHKAKSVVKIPIIGSLNGITPGGWTSYAKKMEEAGADAIELNVYYIPTNTAMDSAEVEKRYLEVLQEVRKTVKIPIAVKLSPFFSSIPNMTQRLVQAGANGIVLFNRFYQPDIDLDQLEAKPAIELSTSAEIRLPMRWIGILYGNVNASLAATGGVHTAEDVIKLLMVGADVTMVCSVLLKYGPEYTTIILKNIEQWMNEHEYESVQQLKGSMSHKSVADPSAFERANYMKALNRYKVLV